MANFIFAQVLLGLVVVALANGLNRERQKSDRLLTNILPAPVADELKENDRVEPRYYPTATIMFTDTVGFTAIAEKLDARQLVAQLDDNFGFFDKIIARNNIEKIKTIGDAYIAAAGVPDPSPTHAVDVVLAGRSNSRASSAREKPAPPSGPNIRNHVLKRLKNRFHNT